LKQVVLGPWSAAADVGFHADDHLVGHPTCYLPPAACHCFNPYVLLLGHRGACHYAPENTLVSFDLAVAHGCDGFEFDVRATADRRAVICHDPRLMGLTVAFSSYAELTARCPSVTTPEEVLSQFAARAYLYIELKVPGLEDLLVAALAAHPPQRGYVVASFLPDVITGVHTRDANIPLGFICDNREELPRWRSLPIAMVAPKASLVGAELVNELHESHKQVFVWTVNQVKKMRSIAELGVDGIVSDDTELLSHTFRRP
jgi:glycerophosphoryl diester phosphodiesterase